MLGAGQLARKHAEEDSAWKGGNRAGRSLCWSIRMMAASPRSLTIAPAPVLSRLALESIILRCNVAFFPPAGTVDWSQEMVT
jgi:hypothetical protein